MAAAKTLKLKELEEGEYETEFGRVSITRTDGGYKIVAYINEKALGKNAAKQILQEFLTSAGGEKPV
jgi:hypothetical protein